MQFTIFSPMAVSDAIQYRWRSKTEAIYPNLVSLYMSSNFPKVIQY